MSSPYGPPGGQQGPGSYGGPSGGPWGPGGNIPTYGGQPPGGPQYGAPGGPAWPGQGFGPAYGTGAQQGPQSGGQGPNSSAPSGSGSGAGGSAGPMGPPRAKPQAGVDLARILSLAIGVLGVLAFFFGFLSAWKADQQGADLSISVYGTAGAYLPILLLLIGLLAVAPLVPKGGRYTLPTALLALVGFLAALTQLISGDGSYGGSLSVGAGLILLIVVSLLQAGAAAYAWLTESGTLKPAGATPRAPRPKKQAGPPEPGQAQFEPTAASGRPGGASGFGAAYPPGVDVQGVNRPSGSGPDAPPYSGYVANPYNPSTARAGDERNPYATPGVSAPARATAVQYRGHSRSRAGTQGRHRIPPRRRTIARRDATGALLNRPVQVRPQWG